MGFTDVGNRSNPKQGEIATHALTVYVKSFIGKPGLKYPLLFFASTTVTGYQLASIMWEFIGLLEMHGLEVNVISLLLIVSLFLQLRFFYLAFSVSLYLCAEKILCSS